MDDARSVGLRFYRLANQRRWDDMLTLVADDYVGHGLGVNGKAGLRQDLETFAAAFPDLEFTIEDTIAEGDKVAIKSTMRGTHRGHFAGVDASGKRIEVGSCDVIRVRDGHIAELWALGDSGTLFLQIGAIPAP
jgi:steroid delta-isomerase-like uncharacterized protein